MKSLYEKKHIIATVFEIKKASLLFPLIMLFLTMKALSQEVPRNAPTPDTRITPPRTDVRNMPDVPPAYDNTVPMNYIRTWQPKKPMTEETDVVSADRTVSEVGRTTQYFDGLGRPLQTVGWQALPDDGHGEAGTSRDLVVPVIYDWFGREVYKYMPYASGSNNGDFKTNPFAEQQEFYLGTYPQQQKALQGEQLFYSKKQYETSPLSRVEKTFAPGNSWAGSEGTEDEHSVSVQYLVNDESDEVQIWNIGFDNLTYEEGDVHTNLPYTSEHPYEAGQLYKTVTTDEQKNEVIEYKDKEGRVVLKKVQAGDVTRGDFYTNWLMTYYVYDDLGQLRFVIPPKAVTALRDNGWRFTDDITNELCFRYEYDARQRVMAKKVPGAGWVYMVYDSRDRLVFSQDANMRGKQQWMYTLYDALNRVVETGMTPERANPRDMQQKQTEFDNGHQDETYEERMEGAAADGTSFTSTFTVCYNFICDNRERVPLTLTYYDDYSQTNKTYVPDYADLLSNAEQALRDNNVCPDYPSSHEASRMTTGTVTSTRVRVIEDPDDLNRGNWLETVTYYDDKGRAVQVNSDNYAQRTDIITSLYDFTGKVVSAYDAHTNHICERKPQTGMLTTMRYDEGGRLLEVHKELDGDRASDRVIARNRYDAMGQLWRKDLGQLRDAQLTGESTLEDKPLEGLNYSYNIRGWLKGINWNYKQPAEAQPRRAALPPHDPDPHTLRQWFAMDLSYDRGYDKNQYNGNIAGMRWQSGGDGVERSYGYGYDGANRLLYGDFNQAQGNNDDEPGWNKQDPDGSGLEVDFSMMMGTDGTGANAYDENGNILQIQQKGLLFATDGAKSDWIDKLAYRYITLANTNQTNKLLSVHEDARHEGSLGDFTDSREDNDDYGYDANGNLTGDNNKHISGITYNHLNLPYTISVKSSDGTTDKGTITYTYDATGNKLQKRTDEAASDANRRTETVTITTYCGLFTYESISTIREGQTTQTEPTTLQFISHDEGRLRILDRIPNEEDATMRYAYDYFIKDHLGNVRMVLTDEYKKEAFPPVTFEDVNTANESMLFDNADKDRTDQVPPDFGNVSPGHQVQLLRKSSSDGSSALGAGKLLRVMAGDEVNARVNYYTPDETAHNDDANGMNTLVAGLGAILTGSSSPLPVHGAGEAVTSSLSSSPLSPAFLGGQQPGDGDVNPKAYLNVVFFDEQFHFVAQGSTAVQVSMKGSGQPLQLPQPVEAQKNGYVYIYLSNESNNFVYFDGLQVVQQHGPLVEETHYYPFGLTMAGISSKALGYGDPGNRKKYNSIELDEDLGIEEYEAYYRDLDPQTGRWWQIDPKCEIGINPDMDDDDDETTPEGLESISPYASMNDNPAKHADPLGDLCCAVAEQMMQTTNMVEQQIIEAGGGPEDLVGDGVAFTWEVAGTLAAGVTAVFEWASEKVSPAPKVIPLTPLPPKAITQVKSPTIAPPKAITPAKTTTAPKAITPVQRRVNTTVNAHGQKKQSTGSVKKSGDNHMRQYKNNKQGNSKNNNQKKGAEERRLKNKPID